MKSILILLLSSIFFQSCLDTPNEDTQEEVEESIKVPQIGEGRWEVRSLVGEEGTLARDFCRSLDEKRSIFRRDYLGASLNFKVEKRDCGLTLEQATVVVRLNENPVSGDLEFIPQSFDLAVMEEVQTVDRGIFSDFCAGFLSRSQSTNTMDFGENSIQQFRFYTVREGIRGQIKTLEMVDEEEKVTALDEVTLNNTTSSGRPLGLILERIRLESCTNQSTNKTSFYWRQRL